MNPSRRPFLFSQPQSASPSIAPGFVVCPIGAPSDFQAWQHWNLYQAAYAQARAVLAPPRHLQLMSCLN